MRQGKGPLRPTACPDPPFVFLHLLRHERDMPVIVWTEVDIVLFFLSRIL